MFNTIKENRGKFSQVIFTPDRMTLQIEETLFDVLNEKCVFDVDVTTLTRFTNKIISENNIKNRVLTKPICVALIKKILNENKESFHTIKKAINFNGFASTLFETISMFKSCNVSYDKLNTNTKSTNLNLKLEDLKLVYKKYEEFLQSDYTDSFNKLNLLVSLLKTSKLKNTHFYFMGFDDFTPQMYNVICELVKCSASVNVACAVNYIDELNNKNIFLNSIYLNLLDISKINGFSYNKIYCKTYFKEEFNLLSNNLFGIKLETSKCNSKNIELFKFNNLSHEIMFAIKKMQWLIINENLNYDDFVFVTPNIADYKQQLETIFSKTSIPYFFDESEPISNSIILRFYFDLFDLINGNFNKRDLFNFLHLYFNISDEILNLYEDVVNKSGFNYLSILKPIKHLHNEKLNPLYDLLNKFLLLQSKINKKSSIFSFCEELLQFSNDVDFNNFINNLSNKYKQKENILEFNKLNNVVLKVNKGFKEISEVLQNYETSFQEFSTIVKAYFENMTIVMPPILANSVFVTDIIKGEIPNKKYAFILGMEEGKMPIVQKDMGLITDKDIEVLTSDFKLTPTVNLINKRNKFKVYETLLKFENLVCCYVCMGSNGEKITPSEVINNLVLLFPNLKIINGSLMQHGYQNAYANDYFLFNNTNVEFAKLNFIENLKLVQTDSETVVIENTANLYNALSEQGENSKEIVDNLNYENNIQSIELNNIFESKKEISVSEIESYYSCPFKHFADYIIKLEKPEDSEFNALEYGNILHEYVKLLVPAISKFNETELSGYGLRVIDEILSKKEYEHLVLNPNNKNEIKSLKKEILRINKALLNLNSSSSLKPVWLEKKFSNFEIGDNEKIQLKGVIDRVDFDDEVFSVIDYKTGASEFNSFTDIVSGKKLQLFVYAFYVSKKTGKLPIGAFYMPLKNDYTKNNAEELYKLRGVVSDNLSDILKIDRNLCSESYTSNVLNLKTKKSGEITGKILISRDEFNFLSDFVINMVLNAVAEIKSGCILPNPLKSDNKITCDYCPYLGLCKFNEEHGNSCREIKPVKSIKELEN